MYDNFQKTNRHNIAFLWSNWPILVAFILFYQIIAKTVHFILNVYFEYVLRSKHEKYFVLYVMNQIWSIKQDKKGPNYVTSIPSIVAPVCIYKVAGNPVVVVSIGHWLFLMFNWTPIVSISAQPSAIQLDLHECPPGSLTHTVSWQTGLLIINESHGKRNFLLICSRINQ